LPIFIDFRLIYGTFGTLKLAKLQKICKIMPQHDMEEYKATVVPPPTPMLPRALENYAFIPACLCARQAFMQAPSRQITGAGRSHMAELTLVVTGTALENLLMVTPEAFPLRNRKGVGFLVHNMTTCAFESLMSRAVGKVMWVQRKPILVRDQNVRSTGRQRCAIRVTITTQTGRIRHLAVAQPGGRSPTVAMLRMDRR
jgi:hypothetical protein